MKVELIQIGPNFTEVRVGRLSMWFSYRTAIAYQHDHGARWVRVNEWSSTTGKHLNQIDGGTNKAKELRISGDLFTEYLENTTDYEACRHTHHLTHLTHPIPANRKESNRCIKS